MNSVANRAMLWCSSPRSRRRPLFNCSTRSPSAGPRPPAPSPPALPLLPTPRPLERTLPLFHPPHRLFALHLRLEALRDFPLFRDFLAARPHATGQARQVRRSQRRGLEHSRTHDGDAEQIRLELHEEVVRGGATVDAQLFRFLSGVLFHGVQK